MYVRVHAYPGAKKERVTPISGKENTFDIMVREPAERNMANTRIRELVALQYHVPLGSVRFITGHRSGTKILSITQNI